jgi:hypothetical protein
MGLRPPGKAGVPDPGDLRLRGGDRRARPLGLLPGPANYARGALLLQRPLRRGDKRRSRGPGEALGEALHVLPARGLLRRCDGRGPGRGRSAPSRGGLPAGVPGASAAPGRPGTGLRGGPVPASRGRRDRRGAATRRGPSAAAAPEAKGGAGRWELYHDRSLLLVAAIACLGLLAEGEMEHWSGIYLRDTLGLAAIVGGSGVAVFYGARVYRVLLGRNLQESSSSNRHAR